jgi:hypothetical protein
MMVLQSRQTKVLVTLVASMTVGIVILRALGYNPPSAGAFCLSGYHRLTPVKTIVLCRTAQTPQRWKRIEIFRSGEIGEVDSRKRNAGHIDTNCHFIICNGRLGGDGQIVPTEKWTHQVSVNHPSHHGTQPGVNEDQTIYICVVTNGPTDRPTNYQLKRIEALVVELCRRLGIRSKSVRYPAG